VALPSGRRTKVVGIDVGDASVELAKAPLSVALRLADEIDVSRGDVLVHEDDLPTVATSVQADVVWMSERRLDPSRTYLLKHTTRTVRASLQSEPLALNDIARVTVDLRAALYVDAYAENRTTGAFILIDPLTNDTVAAGMIASATARAAARGEVTPDERATRLGQRGLVVEVPGQAAHDIERALFDRDRIAAVVDRAAAEAVAAAGLIALIPSPSTAEVADLVADILRRTTR
jgi:bifunctional enzyme CysN/CysC/sulfate adenylyltransferase subunit 1